jgi:hypothetical protein
MKPMEKPPNEPQKRENISEPDAIVSADMGACGLRIVGRVDVFEDGSGQRYARVRHMRGLTLTGPWSTFGGCLADAGEKIAEARR